MAEIPTEADQMAAIVPKVSLSELAAAVVSLKVLSTVPRADLGITSARRPGPRNRPVERALEIRFAASAQGQTGSGQMRRSGGRPAPPQHGGEGGAGRRVFRLVLRLRSTARLL